MRLRLAASVSFGLATCLALGGSVDACGGTTAGVAPEGGEILPGDGGDPPTDAGRGAPEPPPPGEPLSLFGAYAVQTVLLGETDRSLAPKRDAWKDYGENLDGLAATAHLAFFLQASVAFFPSAPRGIDDVVLVPSAGIVGRL